MKNKYDKRILNTYTFMYVNVMIICLIMPRSRKCGSIHPLPPSPYAFTASCLICSVQGQLYLYLYLIDEWPNLWNESVPSACIHKCLCFQTVLVSRKTSHSSTLMRNLSLQILPYCTDTEKYIWLCLRYWTAEENICVILGYQKLNIQGVSRL
jgi:hypothetical protein